MHNRDVITVHQFQDQDLRQSRGFAIDNVENENMTSQVEDTLLCHATLGQWPPGLIGIVASFLPEISLLVATGNCIIRLQITFQTFI